MRAFGHTRQDLGGPLREHGRRVERDLRVLSLDVQQAAGEVGRRLLLTGTARRPYLTLAAAAGLGCVIGSGASPLPARLLLRLGARVTAAWAMRTLLAPRRK